MLSFLEPRLLIQLFSSNFRVEYVFYVVCLRVGFTVFISIGWDILFSCLPVHLTILVLVCNIMVLFNHEYSGLILKIFNTHVHPSKTELSQGFSCPAPIWNREIKGHMYKYLSPPHFRFFPNILKIPGRILKICHSPGLKVIKLEFILRLKIKRNDWLHADTCPQAANHYALFWVRDCTQVL